MAWPPVTHQDVQDAVTVLQTTTASLPSNYLPWSKSRAATLLYRLAPPTAVPFPSTTTPTVDTPTVTSSAARTVTGGQAIGMQTGQFTEVGSRGVFNTTFNRLPVDGISGLDFFLTGTTVELGIYPSTTAATPMWIWVNGLPVTVTHDSLTTTGSTAIYVKLVFPSTGRRRIEFFCTHSGSWLGGYIDNASLVAPAPRKPVVAFVGDSFWAGSNGSDSLQSGAFSLSRMLGVECFNQSLGGTGWTNPGAFSSTYGSAARVAAVTAANPELILFQGSVNDDATAGSVQAAAAAAFTAYATALPNTPCIVFGPQPSNATDTVSTNRRTNNQAVRAAAAAASNVVAFHDMIGNASTAAVPPWTSTQGWSDGSLVTYNGSVYQLAYPGGAVGYGTAAPHGSTAWALRTYAYSGTGLVGSPAGNGTRDTYAYSDGIHPTPEASSALSTLEAGIVRSDLYAAAATIAAAPAVSTAPTLAGVYQAPSFNSPGSTSTSVPITAGNRLVATVYTSNPNGVATAPTGGTSLTWTLASQSPATPTAGLTNVFVWTATATTTETATLSVASTGAAGEGALFLRFTGATGFGSAAHAETSTRQTTITTTAASSAVVVVASDWNVVAGKSVWTTGAGAVTDVFYDDHGGSYLARVGLYTDTGAAGSKTVGLTAPTGQLDSIVALEILSS